ncbi:hypothetical protein CVT26_006434 [Gymnopilus dilepis]|uniref:Uncharacterized protein n=1 Tax=Gymnopilus dilepis TaxID=231916 RepID=A0A409Y1X7_9AGAR|nr:hypothetical protein CVT26_006434 [Gymnopilus dilepis]
MLLPLFRVSVSAYEYYHQVEGSGPRSMCIATGHIPSKQAAAVQESGYLYLNAISSPTNIQIIPSKSKRNQRQATAGRQRKDYIVSLV